MIGHVYYRTYVDNVAVDITKNLAATKGHLLNVMVSLYTKT